MPRFKWPHLLRAAHRRAFKVARSFDWETAAIPEGFGTAAIIKADARVYDARRCELIESFHVEGKRTAIRFPDGKEEVIPSSFGVLRTTQFFVAMPRQLAERFRLRCESNRDSHPEQTPTQPEPSPDHPDSTPCKSSQSASDLSPDARAHSITQKISPVDRLDLACNDLAAYYHEKPAEIWLIHLTTMREALRDEADRNPEFAESIGRVSRRLEARHESLQTKGMRS